MSSYTVTINAPKKGVVGVFELKSKAPSHYPCGPAGVGQKMIIGPKFRWSNAMPDADARVEFKIRDQKIRFRGVSCHDKVNQNLHSTEDFMY